MLVKFPLLIFRLSGFTHMMMIDQCSSFLFYMWMLKQFALQCFRKPCSGYKLKEITGSGIFAAGSENGAEESDANPIPNRRMYQV